MSSVIAEIQSVTDRIIERSKPRREAYLERCDAAIENVVHRVGDG